jgi:hypothetical protein
VTHVEVGIEVRVIDPYRPPLPERHERQALAVAGHEVQAGIERLHEILVAGRGPFQDQAGADMHVCRPAVLEVQKRAVEPGETIALAHEVILTGTSLVAWQFPRRSSPAGWKSFGGPGGHL